MDTSERAELRIIGQFQDETTLIDALHLHDQGLHECFTPGCCEPVGQVGEVDERRSMTLVHPSGVGKLQVEFRSGIYFSVMKLAYCSFGYKDQPPQFQDARFSLNESGLPQDEQGNTIRDERCNPQLVEEVDKSYKVWLRSILISVWESEG